MSSGWKFQEGVAQIMGPQNSELYLGSCPLAGCEFARHPSGWRSIHVFLATWDPFFRWFPTPVFQVGGLRSVMMTLKCPVKMLRVDCCGWLILPFEKWRRAVVLQDAAVYKAGFHNGAGGHLFLGGPGGWWYGFWPRCSNKCMEYLFTIYPPVKKNIAMENPHRE